MMRSNLFLILMFGVSRVFAQTETPVYNLETIIDKILANNFEVKSISYDVEITENAATKGNAGMLPNVNLNAGSNYSNNNTELKFAGGIPSANVSGAQSTGYNTSIGLNYTIFNGFARLNNYEKLKLNHDLSEAQLRLTLENAVISAIGLYLDMAKLQMDIDALQQNLKISHTRLNRAELASQFGTTNSLAVLNARVDLNTDSVNLLNAKNQLATIKRQINYLMGEVISTDFSVNNQINLTDNLSLSNVLEGSQNNSVALILAKLRTEAAEIDENLAKANTYPTINFTSSYGLNASQNGAGIILEQRNLGFSAGLNVTMPIFTGGRTKIAMQNAALSLEKSNTQLAQNQLLINKEVYDYWANYQYFMQLLTIERENIKTAELNLKRTEEAYKLGQITSVEYRQAQLGLLSAQNRINAALINIKKAEYQLLRLKGDLVK
ncbi:MAG: TolC family protein [Flavobacteriales bacterium]|nr:TolC family protein [Flavobacteriales bacterium]